MSAWYEDAFGRDYLSLYPHRNDEEATRDVAGLIRLINPQLEEPLLDLCCGAGRHLVALRHAGFACLTGLDLSAELLAEARLRFDAESISNVRLLKADMREIPGNARYRTIISLFTSFGYFEDNCQDDRVLRSTFQALSRNGTFLLDTLNRGHVLANLVPTEEKELDGKRISIHRRITPDGLRVEKEVRISQPGSPETIYRESVRMYEKAEIEDMLGQIGFINVRFFGNLQGDAFTRSTPRMVFVASKAKA